MRRVGGFDEIEVLVPTTPQSRSLAVKYLTLRSEHLGARCEPGQFGAWYILGSGGKFTASKPYMIEK